MKRPLMERIKCRSFLELSHLEKLELIRGIRELRATANEEAKRKKGRLTKTARKNKAKKAKKTGRKPTSKAKVISQAAKLSPAELQKLLDIYG